MSKKHGTETDTLSEILEGVDIIGTLIDTELPALRTDIAEIKSQLVGRAPNLSPNTESGLAELALVLVEIREMIEDQERKIAALDRRLTRLLGAESNTEEGSPT